MMKKIFATILSLIVVAGLVAGATPVVHAQGLVPCGNGSTPDAAKECNLAYFMVLINNIMKYIFALSAFIATIAFAWTGIILLTAQGNPAKITKAKHVASSVLIGFLFVIGAWLLVYTITHGILKSQYNQFIQQSK